MAPTGNFIMAPTGTLLFLC